MRTLAAGLVLALFPAPATIDTYLDRALDATGLPGVAVVVTHGDKVVHATGAGHDAHGNAVTENTPMRVASVSKSFTAAAVMTLVEDGRVELDDEVHDHLPQLPPRITVRHLLNQTSGISDNSVDIAKLTEARTLADYVGLLPPVNAAEPGTRFAYSNVNYNVAARLVEVLSGESYEDYLRRHVFEPLGMHDSLAGGDAPNGFNSLYGVWFDRPELGDGPAVGGSGTVVTTAHDMGRWLVAQNGHGPFSAESLATMHEPSDVDDYGMGWQPDGNGLLVHSGNLWTYNAIQAIDPETGYGYAVMTNGAALVDDTSTILAGLIALSRGEAPAEPDNTRQLVDWMLAAFGLLSVALGVLGVVRARRWAERRRGRRSWLTAARLVAVALPALLFVSYPQAVSFISSGRTVLWSQLWYFALPLTITLAVAALAGIAVITARVVRLVSVR
ncbi:CubicO group peptidase, beta-lactamase class C family [Lentzea fradiae]|uniref:CubicO group peptidase, beta-lactamase class C family n=1 Tax=Lentzea fradiae TaxID=200378 RepID=A0A1G7L3Z1_9PSEU|nr:serine hydrolase domain-containing protein [Lentzea fradiae]SDF43760.1 CubicO group peptidase, beta-lactamase class C family [Lentzea fradiae]